MLSGTNCPTGTPEGSENGDEDDMLAGTKRPFADTELGEEAFDDPD